ncbi:MAG: insulinase family protein [Ignavibacteriales bacterium]|nr:insulinase family protein [Ignavibacteriales bacterium]
MKYLLNFFLIGLIVMIFLSTVSNAQDVDRTKRPEGKATPTVQLPDIQKEKLKNGLQVWLVERHNLPTVAFNLVFQAGSDHDPLNMTGLASMTADVIDEGTKTRDALKISDEIESIGASFNVGSSWDGSFMSLSCLSKYVDKGLDVFVDVLVNPVFPQKEFDRLQKQRLTSLLQQKDQAVMIANNAFSTILYGSNHPYGNNPSGTEVSVKAMTTSDLQKFYQTYYRPNNATLIIVGDVKMNNILPLLEKLFADWKPADIPTFSVPAPPTVEKRKIYLIDKPGAAQSEIRIGYPALPRSTPEFFQVQVMNRMLGGQFMSRINLNLREKHGFTYGARSSFNFQKGVGPFTASAGVHTAKTDSSVQEFLAEIKLMYDKGMTAEELEFVKKGLIGGFALSFETSSQIAGALQSIVLYGLPDDYFNKYLQNYENVTLQDVADVSKKYLDTSRMAVVVVGDVEKIKEGIKALNTGDVVFCDLDGKEIK